MAFRFSVASRVIRDVQGYPFLFFEPPAFHQECSREERNLARYLLRHPLRRPEPIRDLRWRAWLPTGAAYLQTPVCQLVVADSIAEGLFDVQVGFCEKDLPA